MADQPEGERLQKVLAARGVASRRAAEALILAGRVAVNGRVVSELGVRVDPERDQIHVDGREITAARLRYLLLYKPAGYICSAHDERGRRTVLDLLPGVEERVYPVGRLDYATSGLLLLTNDGALTQHILHPSHQVPKTYQLEVLGLLTRDKLKQLRRGVRLEEGLTAPAEVRVLQEGPGRAELQITIREGRNRQIRRMCQAVGLSVRYLKRIKLDFLELGDLQPGEWRELSAAEVRRLADWKRG